jgi:excisionase family DNA binding protein
VIELARLHADDIEAIAQRLAELQCAPLVPARHESDPLLTAAEAAQLLAYTERYVWRLGREGVLPRVKPPGRKYVRFPLSGVLAYRDSGSDSPERHVRARVMTPDASCQDHRAASPSPRKRF